MESKVNKSSLLCCRECWSEIQGFCNIHEEYDFLWRWGPLCSGGVKGKIWCNSWFLAKGEWLWSVGGRQNLLNKQMGRGAVRWALAVFCCDLSLEDSLQLLCTCLACRNELSDPLCCDLPCQGWLWPLAKSRHGHGEARNKAGMLLLTRGRMAGDFWEWSFPNV